jgi:glycerate kinase
MNERKDKDCDNGECAKHNDTLDRISKMENQLAEVHSDIKEIKSALIGDLNNPGWLTKLTNEDKEMKDRIVTLEKKISRYEKIFEQFLLKLIIALTIAAAAGGGASAIITNMVK